MPNIVEDGRVIDAHTHIATVWEELGVVEIVDEARENTEGMSRML